MKKHQSFIIAAVLVLAISATHAAFSFAQSEIATKTSTLEEKLDKLADSQIQLSETISNLLIQEDLPEEPAEVMAAMTSSTSHAVCTTDILNATGSTTYKESDWFPLMIEPGTAYYHNSFIDLNGDGLLDYLFASTSTYSMKGCVFLNTGSGWERVHACTGTYSYSTWTYRGDCADLS